MSEAPLGTVEPGDHLVVEDEIDVELRTPAEVRARILVLAAVLRRLSLENAPSDDPDDPDEFLGNAFDEREWLYEQGLAGELTAQEAALFDSPPGSLTPTTIAEASWQGEALVALAWAIGALVMPPVDATSDPRPMLDFVPRPWASSHDWMRDPAIVSESDAARERERAEIWHWRATIELLRRESAATDRHQYEAAIREVAIEALAARMLPFVHTGDFPARDGSVRDLSGPHLDELTALTGQRLRALNWLCGFGDSWDDVPLDI